MIDAFSEELEDFLTNDWIKVADACAIFAGWVPLDSYVPEYTYNNANGPRQYLRLEDGKKVKPNESGFREIRRIQKKWLNREWNYLTRNPGVVDQDPLNEEIRVNDAFQAGLALKIPRVMMLHDKALKAGIFQGASSPQAYLFNIKNTKAPLTGLLAQWLEEIRQQRKEIPVGQADQFLTWVGQSKPQIPFIEIEEITSSHIYYYRLNADSERIGGVKIYEKSQINTQIKRLCSNC